MLELKACATPTWLGVLKFYSLKITTYLLEHYGDLNMTIKWKVICFHMYYGLISYLEVNIPPKKDGKEEVS